MIVEEVVSFRRLSMISVGDCYIAVLEVPRKSNIRVSNSHCYV